MNKLSNHGDIRSTSSAARVNQTAEKYLSSPSVKKQVINETFSDENVRQVLKRLAKV